MKSWRVVAVGILIAAPGCDAGGQATGTVFLGGEPLMAGSAAFEPSGELATAAPACTAPIVNGTFQTPVDRPLVPGTYDVWIRPAVLEPGVTDHSEQFKPWKTEVTVSKNGGPIVIVVPRQQ